MTETIQKQAQKKADVDWNSKSIFQLFTGSVDLTKPLLSQNRVFYPKYYSIKTTDDRLFCEAYNQAVSELVKKEGIPDWAPIKKIPERQSVIERLAQDSKDISTYTHSSIRERNLVNGVLEKWKGSEPSVWLRLPEMKLLLFGGDVTPRAGRVDILETSDMKWLATFEFLRRDYSNMPWDHSSSD
jgi:hypothetical protein